MIYQHVYPTFTPITVIPVQANLKQAMCGPEIHRAYYPQSFRILIIQCVTVPMSSCNIVLCSCFILIVDNIMTKYYDQGF